MSDFRTPPDRRAFTCQHCGKKILIPIHLPSTTAPCPHCRKPTTSPSHGSTSLPERKIAKPATSAPTTPIKLSPAQRVGPTPNRRPRTPDRKSTESKPPIVLTSQEVNPSELNHQEKFHQMLIDETRRQRRSMLLVALLLLFSAIGGTSVFLHYFYKPKEETTDSIPPPVQHHTLDAAFLSGGWEKEARAVLRDYLSANNSYGKSRSIIGGQSILPEMEAFYQGAIINDLDTPEESFTPHHLSDSDQQRGLFRMSFESSAPATNTPTPPESTRHIFLDPDAIAGQPTRVHAYFLHTQDGLKLDWHLFAQTKHRRLLRFACSPDLYQKQIFRVIIAQDKPYTTPPEPYPMCYRMADPANLKDVIRVWADPNHSPTKALSELTWIGVPERQPITKSATVELGWIGDHQHRQLVIHRLICWEFLGLGGKNPQSTTP